MNFYIKIKTTCKNRILETTLSKDYSQVRSKLCFI